MATKAKAAKASVPTGAGYEALLGGKEQIEKVVKAGSEAAEKIAAMGKERIEAAAKGYDDLASFNRANLDAVVAAGTAAAKGLEAINAEVLAFAKGQLEGSMTATKALIGAKTLQELVDLQNEYAKSSFDAYMAQMARIGELTAKATQDAFEPLNSQVQAAVEKLVRPLAA
jgi:phasin family protein